MAAASQTTTDQDIQTENVEDQSKPQNESQELPAEEHLANNENSDLRCGFCSKFFTDARTLSCGHNFCFPCLIYVQQTDEVKSCLICKELTIPTQDKIKELIPNRDVNQRVGKAMLDLGETLDIFHSQCYALYIFLFVLFNDRASIISLIFKLILKYTPLL